MPDPHPAEPGDRRGAVGAVPAADLAALTKLEVGGKVTAGQVASSSPSICGERWRSPPGAGGRQGVRGDGRSSSTLRSTRRSRPDPDAWAKFCAGEGKALGALMGRVMKATKGKADGKAVNAAFAARRDAT
ncbi:MAG: GatB/YqeY domain-containing protein [Ilumatobacteraceae bacterium]